MLKWYLDKDRNMLKFYSEFDRIQNIPLKIGVPCHKNECPPTILIQSKPLIVSRNLSMISLFHKTFLDPLHDMSSTLEMTITGYPKVW